MYSSPLIFVKVVSRSFPRLRWAACGRCHGEEGSQTVVTRPGSRRQNGWLHKAARYWKSDAQEDLARHCSAAAVGSCGWSGGNSPAGFARCRGTEATDNLAHHGVELERIAGQPARRAASGCKAPTSPFLPSSSLRSAAGRPHLSAQKSANSGRRSTSRSTSLSRSMARSVDSEELGSFRATARASRPIAFQEERDARRPNHCIRAMDWCARISAW